MVIHKHVSVHVTTVFAGSVAETAEVVSTIGFIEKHAAAVVAAMNDMLGHSGGSETPAHGS